MELKTLTTKEVARLCRVSDATVKRWECAGFLESERTKGGHRRFSAEEVARFRREYGQESKNCADDSLRAAASRKYFGNFSDCPFFAAILAGCETEAANLLINYFLQGVSLTKIFDEIVSKALCLIGDLWYKGELSITHEHLASRAAFHAVSKLRGILPVRKAVNKTVICCAPEGDLHELPTCLVQIVFEDAGFEVINFGANTPLFCLAEETTHFSLAAVCISATILENIERTEREFKEFQAQAAKLEIPVIIGGRAFANKEFAERFSADYHPKSFSELALFAKIIGEKSAV